MLLRASRDSHKNMSSKKKGKVGEKIVNSELNPWFFGKVEHRQLNDYTIVDENGMSHQIDHIEIRENGIFCIETKNYTGLIFGSDTQQNWTQVIYGNKYQIPNPVKQNRSHIYHLNKILGGKYKITSVVVMVENNANNIQSQSVVNLDGLKHYLKMYNDGSHYTPDEMDKIFRTLMESKSNVTSRQHIKNIQKAKVELANNICPRCKKKLVLRKGNYGDFYGCSGYPDCKFTKKI